MGLKEWALANGIISGLKFVRGKGHVEDLANKLDQAIDKSFPKRSENIQQAIVVEVLIPLCMYLMAERQMKLQNILLHTVNIINKAENKPPTSNVSVKGRK